MPAIIGSRPMVRSMSLGHLNALYCLVPGPAPAILFCVFGEKSLPVVNVTRPFRV